MDSKHARLSQPVQTRTIVVARIGVMNQPEPINARTLIRDKNNEKQKGMSLQTPLFCYTFLL